ncbi:hypothetical protein CDL15_Pgr023397 [Punica granatum]|uniref:C3H1-type domain-containing protein n=1 Tax=Punica granatum TaxID=22663 RepID=A0A218Y1H3_PUNGR|nr:hypothetical protein CDL15_Pgr023397 [Punica granatum]
MGSVCAEQHKFHHLFSPKNKAGLDIPPRKLLSRRTAAAAPSSPAPASPNADMFLDSPRGFEKFLPYNTSGGGGSDSDDSDSDPYSSDNFRMYDFKVRRCNRSRSHDWTDCPFAHPGEKARRRDPRRYHYSGTVCSEYRRGSCSRGDNCEFSHGVFECWLHPSRYRTEACKDGKNCKRKVCFFAHSQRELRILPLQADNSPEDPTDRSKYRGLASLGQHHLSCLFCHHSSAVNSSPTSTLMGLSHVSSPAVSPSQSLSPPLSPMKHRSSLGNISPVSHYGDRLTDLLSYKDVLNEIMGSLDVMKVSDVPSSDLRHKRNVPWVDVSFPGDDQTQFILSPAAPSPASAPGDSFRFADGRLGFLDDSYKVSKNNAGDGLVAASDPDLGWVNELLM